MNNPFKVLTKGEMAVLATLAALLAVLFGYLAFHVQDARREGTFENRPPIRDIFTRGWERPGLPDPERIEGWMTFKYVNVVFGLEDSVLKNALSVEDPKYPNVPIAKYSKKSWNDKEKFVKAVREAVKANWKPKSAN